MAQTSAFYLVNVSGPVQVGAPSVSDLQDFRAQAMEMSVFNVGPGEAVLMRLGGQAILVDCGAQVIKRNAALGNALRSYITARGIRLIAIVASHPHVDHLNAIETLLQGDVYQVLAPGAVYYHNGETMGTWLTETLLARLNALGPSVIQQTAVQGLGSFPGLGGTTMTMVADGRYKPSPAYKSIIMSVPYGQARILLTGDVYVSYEDALLADPAVTPHMAATALKITHHGSDGGTGANFVRQTVPRIAVASTASDEGHRLERKVRTRLTQSNCVVFDTYRTGGDVAVRSDGQIWVADGREGALYEVEQTKPGVLGVVG